MKRLLAGLLIVALHVPVLAQAESFSSCPAEQHSGFLSGLAGDLHSIAGKISGAGQAVGQGILGFLKDAKDDVIDGAAQLVGYSELLGLRYPVTTYQFQVSPTLTRGSRQDEAGIAALGKSGFKSMIDLTLEGTHDNPAAANAGMKSYNIPILDNSHPTNAQMKQYLDIVTSPANQPAYVHCEAGKGRTGIAVAVYRMAVQHWTLDQAMAEAQKFGVSLPNQEQYLQQFSADLAAGKIAGYPLH